MFLHIIICHFVAKALQGSRTSIIIYTSIKYVTHKSLKKNRFATKKTIKSPNQKHLNYI